MTYDPTKSISTYDVDCNRRMTAVEAAIAAASNPPAAVGALDHRYYSINSGDQTFNIASGFTGSNLTYSVVSAPSGALYSINAATGQMIVQTTSATSGDVVVKATNTLGSATQSFPLFVVVAATYTVLARKSNGTVTVESLAPTIKLALKRETNGTITISETV